VGDAVGQSLPLAVGVALSPLPIVGIVLILVGRRALPTGLAFLLGLVAGIGAMGAVLLVAVGPQEVTDEGDPATWVGWLTLALGLVLLGLAVRGWRRRPSAEDDEAELPSWMAAVEAFGPAKACGAGFVLTVANPKNVVLVLAGTAAVAETAAPAVEQAVAWAVFTTVAALGVALPLAVSAVRGERATEPLLALKSWMIANQKAILSVLLLVIGANLVGDGLSILTG
jgi:threonine/homoserine/homoserine lactone efflux protein